MRVNIIPVKSLHIMTLGALLLLNACATSVGGSGYNATTVTNNINQDLLDAANVKRVVIAHVNLGSPSRRYLQKQEAHVDELLAEKLERAGYEIVAAREFSQRWTNAVSLFGDPVDPTTGRVNARTFTRIVQTVRDQLVDKGGIDAFVFTDLIEKDVYFTTGVSRIARWDGVARKPVTQGPGSGVSMEFNWGAPVKATSIRVVLFNTDLEILFSGVGGVSLNEAVDMRSGTDFVRRREILGNDNHIREGLALAMHPLIEMNNWPGNPD